MPVAYFDGPGGTQVPRAVVDAMADYLLHHNANTHWAYPTSVETDAALAAARARPRRLPGRDAVGDRLRREHDDAHLPPRPRARAALDAGRRDRGHRARPPRERRPVAPAREGARLRRPGRPVPPRDGPAGHGRPRRRARQEDAPPRDRGGLERARHEERRAPGRGPRARRGSARLRGRRPLRAARVRGRGGARRRLPRLLGLQVLRAARGRPLGPPGPPRGARPAQARAGPRERPGPARDGHAEPRGHRGRGRGRGLPRLARGRPGPSDPPRHRDGDAPRAGPASRGGAVGRAARDRRRHALRPAADGAADADGRVHGAGPDLGGRGAGPRRSRRVRLERRLLRHHGRPTPRPRRGRRRARGLRLLHDPRRGEPPRRRASRSSRR